MNRKGKDASDVDPVMLFVRSGIYLDFAFPVVTPDKVLRPEVSKIVSQMLLSEWILASRRIVILGKHIKAMQTALASMPPKEASI